MHATDLNRQSENIETSPKTSTKRHIPSLDGLRGLAITLVVCSHLGGTLQSEVFHRFTQIMGEGWIGVDLFFSLSGFLITNILLETRSLPNYYTRFYIRRALRVWPLYYLCVFIAFVGTHILSNTEIYRHLAETKKYFADDPVGDVRLLPLYIFFLQNFWLGVIGHYSVLAVTWSLCIEEHFYAIWPVIVRKYSIHSLGKIIVIMFVVFLILRILFALVLRFFPIIEFHWVVYHVTPFHLDSLAAGALLAISLDLYPELIRNRNLFNALTVVGGLISLISVYELSNSVAESVCYTSLALGFGGLMGLVLGGSFRNVLENRQLRYLGRISFGVYMIHAPVMGIFSSHALWARIGFAQHVELGEILAVVLSVSLSLLLASVSWFVMESKILTLKSKLAP